MIDIKSTTIKIKKHDDEPIIALKFSRFSQHLIAVKHCKKDDKNEK